MNKLESNLLLFLEKNSYKNQRILAKKLKCSLGAINQALNELQQFGFLDSHFLITENGKRIIEENSPKNAIILAAGFGMRMVPINNEIPKGLLKVKNQILIERIITQLHEKGIYDIIVVTGFLKEKFEYLIDKFNINLVYNKDYNIKNNLHSLALVQNEINNSYIIPSDVWCLDNPFSNEEIYSWYMITDQPSFKTNVRINRKHELIRSVDQSKCCKMIGIAYINKKDSVVLRQKIQQYICLSNYDQSYWEEAMFQNNKLLGFAKIIDSNKVVEIDTYEQLRDLDCNSDHLKADAIEAISNVFNVSSNKIERIQVLKKGMTNRSFLFSIEDKKYIMRIPGEGTDNLINRQEEADVYHAINSYNLSDPVLYIDSEKGYKITEFYSNAQVCDPSDLNMVNKCMKILKKFHNLNLKVDHKFDLFEKINFYESLWNGVSSIFEDYQNTKENIFSLKRYIESCEKQYSLTHIDAVPDNFLFLENGEIRLIDWEYASMQDPHVDIAMFAIYSMYTRKQIDQLIDCYFDGFCDEKTKIKIYAYIAICGLLWSNWCEYKRNLGIEFGEYSLAQYRYAKEYYKLVEDYIGDEYE